MPSEIKHPRAAAEFFASDAATLRHFDRLAGEHKRRAYARTFVISEIENTERLNAIHKTLYEAYKNGLSFEAAKDALTKLSADKTPQRLKLVFETNLRNAYNAARFEQQLAGSKPYFRYVSALDSRVRDEHAAWHGVVLPKDDAFWASNYPPNGFGCRCKVQAISAREAKALGAKRPPNAAPPSAGSSFASNPLQPDGGLLGVLAQKVRAMPAGNGYEKIMRKKNAQALANAAACSKEFNDAYVKIKPLYEEALEDLRRAKGAAALKEEVLRQQISQAARAAKQVAICRKDGAEVIIDGYNIRTHLHHQINAADYALIPRLLKDAPPPKVAAKYDKNGKHTKDELTYSLEFGRRWTLTLTRMVGDDKRLFVTSLFDDLSDI